MHWTNFLMMLATSCGAILLWVDDYDSKGWATFGGFVAGLWFGDYPVDKPKRIG